MAAIVHPNAWYWHSPRQIRAWHAGCVRRGLILVPPEDGWRAVLAAADVVIGDHGSVSYYAASTGVPVLLAAFPAGHVVPGSPVADFGQTAPRLRLGAPLVPQIEDAAAAWPAHLPAAVRREITDAPGRAARIIRSVMYQLMNLPEPPAPPEIRPVPVPEPAAIPDTFGALR